MSTGEGGRGRGGGGGGGGGGGEGGGGGREGGGGEGGGERGRGGEGGGGRRRIKSACLGICQLIKMEKSVERFRPQLRCIEHDGKQRGVHTHPIGKVNNFLTFPMGCMRRVWFERTQPVSST